MLSFAGVGRRHERCGGYLPRVQPRELGRRGPGHREVDDTTFALGLLTLFGRRAPDHVRAFMLTVVVADD
jgi:Na+/H+ antiporter NhaA